MKMLEQDLYKTIQEVVSFYVKDYEDTTNLLGISPVRNIVYILTDLECKIGLKIDSSFINKVKQFSVVNLCKVIPEYI
jgi:hypothetical protein